MIRLRPALAALALVLFLPLGCAREEKRQAAEPPPLDLLFTYGSEKEKWVAELTAEWNQAENRLPSGEKIRVEAVAMGSGQAIDEILDGKRLAHLTSPASAAFVDRGNARSRALAGSDLLGRTESLVLSPVVIALWRPMAESLGWGRRPIGWSEILALSRDQRGWAAHDHPEWGAFKLGHTHPELSNSGLSALFAQIYSGAGKVAGLTLADVGRPAVAEQLAAIQGSIVHYGTSTGFFGRRMFAGGPAFLSAAVLYENMVIESYAASPAPPLPVVAVYPKEGTFWSDHPIGIVERPWVSPRHREAARLYIRFLLGRRQQERAMALGFRPADPAIPLGPPFDAAHGVDPREPQTTLEVPPALVMEAMLRLWHENKKQPDVALVFDRSGSMNEEQRLPNARDGALRLLAMLHEKDLFSLLPFSDRADWALRGLVVGEGRDRAEKTIAALFADGGTALYDAIAAAYDEQLAARREDPRRIRAIVVLTDGEDNRSKIGLHALVARLRADQEAAGIRVFTIGYGAQANRQALEAIAEASQARFFEGRPENIREVFFEISTFF
jgi:Ca-activated chloride channel family protein